MVDLQRQLVSSFVLACSFVCFRRFERSACPSSCPVQHISRGAEVVLKLLLKSLVVEDEDIDMVVERA